MTITLRDALAALERLPADRQAELAEALKRLAEDERTEDVAFVAAVEEGLRDADAGRFATDEDVADVLSQYRC